MRAVSHMATVIATAASVAAAVPAQAFESTYLYNLSTLTGRVATGWREITYDEAGRELFLVAGDAIRVFNQAGMETATLRGEAEVSDILSVAALEDGDLAVLARSGPGWSLVRCNYRGEPKGTITPSAIPPAFFPDVVVRVGGRLYLADRPGMRALVMDVTGKVEQAVDVAQRIGLAEKKRGDTGISGFTVDRAGNLVVAVAPLFKVYVIPPEGDVRSFGKPGGGPGRFNIVNGVAVDASGNFYVADTLKCAVIAFDRDFNFLGEFGYRGRGPGQLVAPRTVAYGDGRVFVSQGGNRGVAVYRVRPQ